MSHPSKQCYRCHTVKGLDEFPIDRYQKDGHYGYCKLCKNSLTKARRLLNPIARNQEKQKAKIWKTRHPYKVLEMARKHYKAYRQLGKPQARKVVETALRNGTLHKASTCVLPICNRPADHAHHWKGYTKEHQLDVQWVCKRHHPLFDKITRLFLNQSCI
jgi:hypothetical protein